MGKAVRDSLEPVRGSVEFIGNGLIELELGDGIGIGRIVLGALIESEVGLGRPSGGREGGGAPGTVDRRRTGTVRRSRTRRPGMPSA
jgi:hypothetical protein